MRLFLELLVVFFTLLTIYRRLIEPFIEGLKGVRKPYNRPEAQQAKKFRHSSAQNKVKPVDPMEIQDAEFEEIK